MTCIPLLVDATNGLAYGLNYALTSHHIRHIRFSHLPSHAPWSWRSNACATARTRYSTRVCVYVSMYPCAYCVCTPQYLSSACGHLFFENVNSHAITNHFVSVLQTSVRRCVLYFVRGSGLRCFNPQRAQIAL